MIQRLEERINETWPVKLAREKVVAFVDSVRRRPVAREVLLLADSVARQFRVRNQRYTLDDVFRAPRAFIDPAMADMSAEVVDRAYDFDMRFSIKRFAECVEGMVDLSFVGVYAKTDAVDMSVERERAAGQSIPDRWSHYHDAFMDMQSPQVMVGTEGSTMVVPLLHRGVKLGAALYDKPHFSRRDLVSLIYMTSQFSRHLRNCKTGYQWRKEALTDILTGLPNRRKFLYSCTRMIDAAQKKGSPMSLLLLDLDHFKMINDELGHEEGDNVLRSVSDVLRANFRESDIARYGGEEFVVAVDANYDVAHKRANDCLIALNEIPHMTKISATFGVASVDRDVNNDIEDIRADDLLAYLVRTADSRMYAAKPFRNAVYCIYSDSLTGFPNVVTFKDELKKNLDPDKRASRTVAVYLVNVKGMTSVIRELGQAPSWNLFRDSVQALNGPSSEFDTIARVHTRDEVIASAYFDDSDDCFGLAAEKARRALDILRQPRNGNFFNPLNFVMGVTLYNPAWVNKGRAVEIEQNPYILLEYAQQVADDAKLAPEKYLVRKYKS